MFTLYNSKTHQKEPFVPLVENKVSYYACGPTVYNYVHIGNLRCYIFCDTLNRFLRYKGFDVKFAMNLTDVDDKTIRDSSKAGKSLREFTQFYGDAFLDDLKTLGIKKPDYIIRATEEVDEMIQLIQILLEKGFAYKAESGDVFFKISRFHEYGKMAGIDREKLKANADGRLADDYQKEDAQDFVLWKAWVPNDGEVVWDAPFGKGRPGWSIECSAMARKYLGQPIDIHAGGIDLIFPHHTNEIAQSECAYGCEFVRNWVHCAFLIVNGHKMSKSLGNFYTLRDLMQKGYSPLAIRFELLKAHYRATIDFQEQSLSGNETVIEKLSNLVLRLKDKNYGQGWGQREQAVKDVLSQFECALDDDLNMPLALSYVFEFISEVNKNFEVLSEEDKKEILSCLYRLDEVLALIPQVSSDITEEQEKMIKEREEYRKLKQWDKADALKQELLKMGIEIKDTPNGPLVKNLNLS